MRFRLGILGLVVIVGLAGVALTARAVPHIRGNRSVSYMPSPAVATQSVAQLNLSNVGQLSCGNEDPPPPDDPGDGYADDESYDDVMCPASDNQDSQLLIAPGALAACDAKCASWGYPCLYLYDWVPLIGSTTTYCRCFTPQPLSTCNAAGWASAIKWTGSYEVP